MNMNNASEVARLMQQIELETEAARQGLTGLAAVARHEFITAKYERLMAYGDQLAPHIGKEKAMQVVLAHCEAMVPEPDKPTQQTSK